MKLCDFAQLKNTAKTRLLYAEKTPQRLILIHTGVSLGAALLITLIQFFLQQQIGQTGGLSGIGSRSILSTMQSAVSLAGSILLPFWEIGILYAVLRIIRQQQADKEHLLAGFYRFGPVFRLMLLRAAIVFGLVMLCMNVAAVIFMSTSLADGTLAILQPLWAQAEASGVGAITVSEELIKQMIPTLIPLFVVFGVLALLVVMPCMYRIRMANYLILEEKKTGAIAAVAESWNMTRGNTWALICVDLRFWWFFLLKGLAALLGYGAQILVLAGVCLPMPEAAAQLLFYCLSVPVTLGIYWRFGMYLHAVWAQVYETLLPKEE